MMTREEREELENKKIILTNLANLTDMSIGICEHLNVDDSWVLYQHKRDLEMLYSIVNDIDWELENDNK